MLVHFLRYIAVMSENQINACPILVLSWVFGWTTSGDVPIQSVKLLTNRNTELQDQLWQMMAKSSCARQNEELDSGTAVVTQLRCHGSSETARVHGVRCRVVLSEVRSGLDRVSLKSRC